MINNIMIFPELHRNSIQNLCVESGAEKPALQDHLKKEKSSVSLNKKRKGGGFNKTLPNEKQKRKIVMKPLIQKKVYKVVKTCEEDQSLSNEIKMIERKIKACQKKIQTSKKKHHISDIVYNKVQDNEDRSKQKHTEDKIKEEHKNFDYLTNPQQHNSEAIQQSKKDQKKQFDIKLGIENLQNYYENKLKRKFQRRDTFPHIPCKRKVPKLFITKRNNSLTKHGKVLDQKQHFFRVITKEATPQEIYPTIPNFPIVKDSLCKSIVAYLGDYKPFLEKSISKEKQLKRSQGKENHKIQNHRSMKTYHQ